MEPQPPYVCKWQFVLRDGDDTAKIRCSTFRLGRERGDCRDGACACEQSHVKSRSYLQIRGNITKPIADRCEKDVYSDRCAECKVNEACDYEDCKGSSRAYCGNPRGGKLNIELASRKGRDESLIKVEVFVKEGENPELCCVYSRSILVKFLLRSQQLSTKTVLFLYVEIDALLTSGRCSRDVRINCFFKDYVDVSDCNLIPNCDEFIRRVLESLGDETSVSGDGPNGQVEEHKPTATTVTELLTSAPPTEPSKYGKIYNSFECKKLDRIGETATPETEKATNKDSKKKNKDKKKEDKKKDKKDKSKKREREG